MQPQLLIIHQGAIGDLILSLPSLYAIRTTFRGYHIEALGYPQTLSLLHQRFYVESITSIDRALFAALYRDEKTDDAALINYFERFERIFLFGGWKHARVARIIKSLTYASVVRIDPFPEDTSIHVIDYQLKQVKQGGVQPSLTVPMLFPTATDVEQASCLLASRGVIIPDDIVIAVHPGSGSNRKNMPAEHFVACLKYLSGQQKCWVLLIQGPADEAECRQIEQLCSGVHLIKADKFELPLLAALIQHCHVYIGNDSGITHMAAALGVPTIALFGPTDPRVWGPRGKAVCIMQAESDHCGLRWPMSDMVAEKAMTFLATNQSSFPALSAPSVDKSFNLP